MVDLWSRCFLQSCLYLGDAACGPASSAGMSNADNGRPRGEGRVEGRTWRRGEVKVNIQGHRLVNEIIGMRILIARLFCDALLKVLRSPK